MHIHVRIGYGEDEVLAPAGVFRLVWQPGFFCMDLRAFESARSCVHFVILWNLAGDPLSEMQSMRSWT